jgi:protein SCO1
MTAGVAPRQERADAACPEHAFAALIDRLAPTSADRDLLADLLLEEHDLYAGRGATAVIRMRGWALTAFERIGLPDSAVLRVLEELENGQEPYLVAAAARAARGSLNPTPALAPFLVRAFHNLKFNDDLVSFERYGAYPESDVGTTALQEVAGTLGWLGPKAHAVLPELRQLLDGERHRELSPAVQSSVRQAIQAIEGAWDPGQDSSEDCCALSPGFRGIRTWISGGRAEASRLQEVLFQDQDGREVDFSGWFQGKPSIVVFFYTRCPNPRKCSLTISKLARVQQLLVELGLEASVRTAAITYDPGWDLPDRLRSYGRNRGLRMDENHRLLRSHSGLTALRAHFTLGVNFIQSVVNQHRVEAFVLDRGGRVAARFERLQWYEAELVEHAVRVLREGPSGAAPRSIGQATFSSLAAILAVLLPKCAVCWTAYFSALGLAGLERMPYVPGLWPLLALALGINLASLWLRGQGQRRWLGFCLSAVGALSILVLGIGEGVPYAGPVGVGLTVIGSVLSVAWTPLPSLGRPPLGSYLKRGTST